MASALAFIRRLPWNDDERRPRLPFRLLAGVAIILVSLAGTSLLLQSLGPTALRPLLAESVSVVVVVTVLSGVVSTVAIVVVGRFIDRRYLADFGFGVDRDWWLDCGFGFVLGAALMTLIFGVELAFGWVVVTGTFRSTSFLPGFLSVTTLFLVVGIQEELFARGYLLTNLGEGLRGWFGERGGTATAVVGSSLLFGALHLGNPNATLVSALSISAAGVMLAIGYVLTDELAIPIGLHISWNLFQGGVYGFPVSGLGIEVAVISVSQRGPPVWTGGAFGPEAGLLGVAAIVLGTLAVVGYVRVRYRFLAIHPGLTTPDLRWRD